MISEMRKRFKDSAFKGMIWISLIAFSASGVGYVINTLLRGREQDEGIGTVNGLVISPLELRHKMIQAEQRIAYIKEQFGAYADQFLKALGWASASPQELALTELVQEKVLDDVANKLKLRVAPNYIVQKLQDPTFVMQELGPIGALINAEGGLNMPALTQYLRKQGLTVEEFENAIEDKLRRETVLGIARTAAYVPNFLVRQRFIQEFAPKKYEILRFSRDSYVTKEPVTQERLKAFFDIQNKKYKKYIVPEKRTARVWTFDPAAYGIEISDKEVASYYAQRKKSDYVTVPEAVEIRKIVFKLDKADEKTVRAKAEKVLKEAQQNPKQFAALAQQYSQDQATAKKAGYAGFLEKDDVKDPAVVKAAFALKEDLAISPLIRSKEGIEIIQRISKRSASYKPLEQVSTEIRTKLLNEKFKRQFPRDAAQIVQESTPSQQRFINFIKEKRAVESIVKDQEKTASGIGATLFRLEKDALGFTIEGSKGIIVQLVDVVPAHASALDTVQGQVIEDYRQHEAFEKMREAVDLAYKQAETALFDDLKITHKAVLTKTDFIAPTDSKALHALFKQGINPAQLTGLATVGAIEKEVTPEYGYLLRLAAIQEPPAKEYEAQKDTLRRTLYQELQRKVEYGFVASLYRNATIRIKQSLR